MLTDRRQRSTECPLEEEQEETWTTNGRSARAKGKQQQQLATGGAPGRSVARSNQLAADKTAPPARQRVALAFPICPISQSAGAATTLKLNHCKAKGRAPVFGHLLSAQSGAQLDGGERGWKFDLEIWSRIRGLRADSFALFGGPIKVRQHNPVAGFCRADRS